MIHDERPVHCYSLDLNDGSVREIMLRGRWEGSGREFVVYAKAPLEDSYVVVCRRNEFIGIGMSQAGEPEQWKEMREYYAPHQKGGFLEQCARVPVFYLGGWHVKFARGHCFAFLTLLQ